MGLAELKAMQAELERLEVKTGPAGAVPRTPKQMLLDHSDVSSKDPEYHYRFVSTVDAQKAQGRIVDGYRVVPEAEGGRAFGGLALMKIPRARAEARIARQKELSARRLDDINREMEREAEGMSRVLQDKYGIKKSPEELLVKE